VPAAMLWLTVANLLRSNVLRQRFQAIQIQKKSGGVYRRFIYDSGRNCLL